jgi:hypothetical protein
VCVCVCCEIATSCKTILDAAAVSDGLIDISEGSILMWIGKGNIIEAVNVGDGCMRGTLCGQSFPSLPSAYRFLYDSFAVLGL